MTAGIHIRKEGRAGRITLDRPSALNALTYEMCLAIDAALKDWAGDDDIALLIIDAEGDRAFCAGGDIAEMFATGSAGDYSYGQRFWRDEYRMNARLFEFPRPVVSFLQGFTMGGGVGVGCHGSHRIVDHESKIAMPEVGIGLVPDVGGSLILALAPGHLGEYLGTTAHRMGAGDAIYAGFADYLVPRADWEPLKAKLIETGDPSAVDAAALPAPDAPLRALQPLIDRHFGAAELRDIGNSLTYLQGDDRAEAAFAADTLKAFGRNSPLAMACAVDLIRRVRMRPEIRNALEQEFRFTARSMEHGDFIEGIRAAIIDRDRSPRWKHSGWDAVTGGDAVKMLLPLGAQALTFQEDT